MCWKAAWGVKTWHDVIRRGELQVWCFSALLFQLMLLFVSPGWTVRTVAYASHQLLIKFTSSHQLSVNSGVWWFAQSDAVPCQVPVLYISEGLFCAMLRIASTEEKLGSTISEVTQIVTQNIHCMKIMFFFHYFLFLIPKAGFLKYKWLQCSRFFCVKLTKYFLFFFFFYKPSSEIFSHMTGSQSEVGQACWNKANCGERPT